jgi:hypothetical protein
MFCDVAIRQHANNPDPSDRQIDEIAESQRLPVPGGLPVDRLKAEVQSPCERGTTSCMSFSGRTIVAATVLAALSVAGEGLAQPWYEGFEGPQASWREGESDVQHRIVGQQRLQGGAHTGNGCESLRLQAETGSYIYIAHDVGSPLVIDELAPSVWIKSDRPGLQIAARIVLPRSVDPRTGRPLTSIVIGSAYNDVGGWQQLQLTEIPRLLTRSVHVLRTQFGPQVDPREAYLEAVLLNVYGGQGVTNVWIDDLAVAGYVARQNVQPDLARPRAPEAPLTPVRLPPVQAAVSAPRHRVKLDRSTLLVDDWPMFPRVIRRHGEPLDFLKKIGFNTVWLDRLPMPEVLAEAERLGLWLICPPPRPTAAELTDIKEPSPPRIGTSTVAEIGPQFDCVLAWDMGNDLIEADLEATARWADQVRAADRRCNRPLICRPRTNLRGFSRSVNLLLIDRRPLGTSLEMSDYATWVRQQPLLATLGTPVWTTVQTQPNEALRQQLAALEPGYSPPLAVSADQMRLLAYTAVASGSRGLVFVSDSPLDAPDADTRQRAMTLELLNLELQPIELWAAAGTYVANARSNVREVCGAVLRTDRASLLLPLWLSPGGQCVPSQSAVNSLTLVTLVPKTYNAYELTPHGAQQLRRQPVAGGLSVTLDEFGLASQILLSHEASIVSAVDRRAVQVGSRAARLQRDLAVHKLYTVQALVDRLSQHTRVAQGKAWLDSARANLQSCDAQLAANDSARATVSAERATRSLRLIERAYWDAAVKKLVSPVTSPAALSFDTLPCHWRFYSRLLACRRGPNLLDGADFEDLGAMMRAGWRHILHAAPTVQTSVDLAPQAAHGGRLGVRLAVVPADPKNPPAAIENPPILFVSPSVQVEAGQIVCIHGWVRVLSDVTASTDGLLVVDSITGEALADRIGKTKGWRQFALYRAVPQPGPMCVTFALSGIGEAWLDDVAIEVLETPNTMTQR